MTSTTTEKSLVQKTQDENRELKLDEVLHLLGPKVNPGSGIPQEFDSSPWRIPQDAAPAHGDDDAAADERRKINRLLEESFVSQGGSIPGSGDFEDYILSNSAFAVSGLLKGYLHSLGISSQLVFGVLLWNENLRNSEEDYEGTPHLWIRIRGIDIDNSNVAVPRDNLPVFYKIRSQSIYRHQENPLSTSLKLYLGSENDEISTTKHNLKVYSQYSDPRNIEKYLYFALKNAHLNPGVKMYDILMRNFIKKEFGVTVPNLESKWSHRCWNCGESNKNDLLKTCTSCNHAKYCGIDCQKSDWMIHKTLHKELKLTREILRAQEIEESQMIQAKQDILAKKAMLDQINDK